jgi:tetratricopeptide (TPR) repeat protein
MNKKWNEDATRWLKANFGRMDLQSLSHALGFPLTEVEHRIKQLKLHSSDPNGARRKAPASLKEAVREISAARKDYEKAIDLFHKRKFEDAAVRFEELIAKHPDEKEFTDRARMYLTACRSGKKGRVSIPSEPEEIYHAAVFEKNRGNVERALELLKKTAARRDLDGRVHYLAACCHALAGDSDQALVHLKKAIAADDQNRIHARLENDLSSLRGTPGFSELVAGV